jgi:hypothetical protein
VTAKELLRERIEALTEEEAAEALELLGLEAWPDFPPAPPEVVAQVRRMLDEPHDRRVTYSTEEVLRSLGIE